MILFRKLFATFFPPWEEEECDSGVHVVQQRKVPDRSKFTRQDYDVIMNEYNIYLECKKLARDRGVPYESTLDDVVEKLNKALGYDKRRTAYSKIWKGEVTRESLGEAANV